MTSARCGAIAFGPADPRCVGGVESLADGMMLMPYTVREAQPTPNPNAIKFVLDRPIAPDGPLSFLAPDSGVGHPIAERLFAIDGVVSLLFLNDFVTVNKAPEAEWANIRSRVKRILKSA